MHRISIEVEGAMLRLRSIPSYGAVPYRHATYSRLLFLSGVVRRFTKETRMKKLQKTFMKWGAAVAKVSLAAAMLVTQWIPAHATDDFGTSVEQLLRDNSMYWFGVQAPLGPSAPPTSGAYRTPAQPASAQVLLADGLKGEYVTRTIGNNADQFAFWPSDESPTHLIFCIEGGPQDLGGAVPPAMLVPKKNPSVQRVHLQTGAVDTILRG